MTYEFKREIKYLVLKWDDIEKYLNKYEREELLASVEKIDAHRSLSGKKQNTYVVVNEDEPYAEKVWELIQEYEEKRAEQRAVEAIAKKASKLPKGSFLNP